MFRHFYPVIGTFEGERTLFKKKRTFWGTFFKKGYNPVLGDINVPLAQKENTMYNR